MPLFHTRRIPSHRTLVAALALFALLLAACGDDDDEPVTAGGSDDTTDTSEASGGGDDIAHPEGAELVLQVERTGGFVPAETVFGMVPPATLLGDGTLIVEGAQIAIYPPPILPPLFQMELDEAGVQRILDAADEAGLLSEPADYGQPNIADGQTTVIHVRAGGVDVTHEIYALGSGGGLEDDLPPHPGLTEEQQARRDEVGAFVASLAAPGGELVPEGASEQVPYEADRFAIRAEPVDPTTDAQMEVEPEVRDWPLDSVQLADAPECLVVEGEEADTLAAELADADTLTRFRQGAETYGFQVRPLLPTEASCADISR